MNPQLVEAKEIAATMRIRKEPARTSGSDFDASFLELQNAVFTRKPVLKEIVDQQGSKKLYEYAKEYIEVNLLPSIQERKDEFINTFKAEVERTLGAEIAQSAALQMENYYYVSTADHHGPICHPFFLNSNLLMSAPYEEYQNSALKYIIVLACANVSLNNSSFPRGLLFNSYAKGSFQTQRLSFLPSNAHSNAVYNFRAYTAEEIEKMKKLLREKVRNGDVRRMEADRIVLLLDEIYSRPEVLSCGNYSDQITKTNYHLWKKFFASSHTKSPADLLYIEQESLVVRLLIDHHLYTDTTISHMFFDASYIPLIDQYFEGITGSYSRKDKSGTYLFWGVSKDKNYRVQLWRNGNELRSEDGSFRISLTPDALKKALEEKQIVPSTLLIFIVLSMYYGLKCLGGFSQVNYLTFMKNGYLKMQVDRGNYRSVEMCARAQTKELAGDVTVAFLSSPKGELVPATGLDLILYGREDGWEIFVQESKQITLREALNPMMPELYRIIYDEPERRPDLLSITTADITRKTGLDAKIEPCVSIS